MASAGANQLDCIVLCPPNISGVYSTFVCNVLADIRAGSFALLDGGSRPLNTVDVDNLAYAVLLALKVGKSDAKRIFISDGGQATWKDLADALLPLAERSTPLSALAVGEAEIPITTRPRTSLWKSVKHLFSSDVREALRRDPIWASFDKRLRSFAKLGGKGMEEYLRHSIEGPARIAKGANSNPLSSRYNTVQVRNVRHRIDHAREVLGYDPPLDFAASLARFRVWYETMHGMDQPFWQLAKLLETLSILCPRQ